MSSAVEQPVPAGPLPRRRLGRTGFEVTVVGVGGWLGILDGRDATPAQKEAAAVDAVRRAVELGVNYFDTSPMYSRGLAECHLGLGLRTLSKEERARLRIATKTGTHPDRAYRYDADSTEWTVENSLRVLFTDHVDALLIHAPRDDADMDVAMGPGGALEVLERLKEQGVIGAIGLGALPQRHHRRAIDSGRFDVILTAYDYTPLRASAGPLIDFAAARDVGVANGSPYGAGLLAGGDPDLAAKRRAPMHTADLERARALWRWCEARGVDLGVLAMQFSLRNPHIAVTLAGPRTAAEVEGNVRHALTTLPDDLWVEFDRFFPTLPPPAPGGEAPE